jgi:hypothetical protein
LSNLEENRKNVGRRKKKKWCEKWCDKWGHLEIRHMVEIRKKRKKDDKFA